MKSPFAQLSKLQLGRIHTFHTPPIIRIPQARHQPVPYQPLIPSRSMASQTTSVDGDDIKTSLWKNHTLAVTEEHKAAMQRVPGHVAQEMLKAVDAVFPFSNATSLLDIACGQGMVFDRLFNPEFALSPSAKLLGMDVSEPMIAALQERQASSTDRWKDIAVWVEDATKLSLPDNSQSHVISQMGIFLVPQWDKALQEAHRVLEFSGVFAMSAMSRSSWNDEVVSQLEVLHPDRKLPRVSESWRSIKAFEANLQQNGFHDVVAHEVQVSMLYDTPEQFVEMTLTVVPWLKPQLQGLSDEQIQEVKDAMANKIKKDYPDHTLPGTALFAIGRK